MSSIAANFLESRPEARAFKVEDLMREIRRGRVRIPSFQRPLAWTRDDARKLVDSLYRGYPVSTLLFWETRADPAEVRLGPRLKVDAPSRSDAWWVVDGQQRLVSLARILLSDDDPEETFALDFDLDNATFAPARPTAERANDASRWLPLNRVVDSEQLIQWLLHQQPGEARRGRAIQLGKRLREYDIPAYIIRSDDEAVLRDIFGRVNSTGKRMKVDQVFEALNSDRAAARPGSLAAMADEVAKLGFGRIDQRLLYRLLRVLQGQDVVESNRDEPQRLGSDEAVEAYALTERVVHAVIGFIAADAGIRHFSLMPYKEPLVTLGKFFHFHPQPKPRSRALLVRWLWRGALNGSHQGSTVSARKSLALIDPQDEERSVQQLLARVGRERPPVAELAERFNFRHANAKLQTLALLEWLPCDLVTAQPLDLSRWLDYRASDDAPPLQSMVRSGPPLPLQLAVANRLIQPPGVGLLKRLKGVADSQVLASHGIDVQAHAALVAGRPAEFLRRRAETLRFHFQQCFDRHARWDETDRPSLPALLQNLDDGG